MKPQIIFDLKGCCTVSVIAVVFIATAFFSFDNLVETKLLSKSYAFIAGAICCALILLLFYDIQIKFDILTILIACFISYILFRMSFDGRLGLKFMIAVSFLLFYLFFKIVRNKYNLHVKYIIVAVCIIQAIYGLLQFCGIAYSEGFRMQGSFDNPAGISALLSACIPFCFSLTEQSKHSKYIGWGCFVTIFITIILSGSRSGIITSTIICIIYLIYTHKQFLKRHKTIAISGLLVFCIICVGLFYMKKDSASGRVLIWKASVEMAMDKPIFGHGPSSFGADYMVYQSKFFKNYPDSKYTLLADNVTHPFNEYILLITEYGVFGLMGLLIIMIFIIKCTKKITAPLLCILSIAIFSLFSYPTRYSTILLLLAYSLAELKPSDKPGICLKLIGQIGGYVIITFLSFFLIRDVIFESRWGNIVRIASLGKTRELLKDYEDLYNFWNGNPLFLYNYGAVLNKTGLYRNSICIMEECENSFNDYNVQLMLADDYYKLSDWSNSLERYKLCFLMCPNRFVPLYKQMLIYDEIGDYVKADSLALVIIHKPTKIPSNTINRIIKEANGYLEK